MPVGRLSVAGQQLVEIARALSMASRVLILDEPTAVLSLAEQENLFRIIAGLRGPERVILYASHRLGPVRVSPDRVRRGQPVMVTTTVRAGNTPVFDLVVGFYDGDPDRGGQIVAAERIPHLAARGHHKVGVVFTPGECGRSRLVAVAGEDLPIEDRRASEPVRVTCSGKKPR